MTTDFSIMKILNPIIIIVFLCIQTITVFGKETPVQKADTTLFTDKEPVDSFPTFSYMNKQIGKESLCEFYIENLKYPVSKDCIGTVYVVFTIEKDSTLTNVRIFKGIPGCNEYDNEALRLVNLMNHLWKPAINRNRIVRYEMIVPVFFSFSNCEEKIN